MPTVQEILAGPIDHRADASVASLLADLQGNILKGHGRDHTVHLFLNLRPDTLSDAKKWIKDFADQLVTSAQKQFAEMEDFRKFRIIGDLFVNFFLSRKGYDKLGIPAPQDPKFVDGMKASGAVLDDPPSAEWEDGYKGEIHASILLAHDDESELNREARRILQEVKKFAEVVAGERGKAMRNKNCETVEHFGYVDGRSQPLFLEEDIAEEREKEPGTVLYDPSAPLDLVLVQDRNGEGDLSFGSYFVFRKLEQDVLGFKKAEEQLADELGLKGSDEELAGALVVGRFEDGTPVVLQKTDGQTDPVPNNFNYKTDPNGLRCPFQAHIRKVNPRGDTTRLGELEERERRHRIARRGITYGERCKEPKDNPAMEDLPSKDVGLLFMCFQSDIGNQFEFIQKQWANKEDFLLQGTGIDPVIGQHSKNQNPIEQRWSAVWGRNVKRSFSFQGFVKLKGGEYFFAPSLSALRNI